MAKTRAQKEEALAELRDSFRRAKSTIFVHLSHVGVNDINEFRSTCHKEDIKYVVSKKTLLSKVMQELELPLTKKDLEGQVGVVFGFGDVVTPAKVVAQFGKTHEMVSFLAGILDGKLLSRQEAMALAKLPSREELLAKLIGSLNVSLSQFVSVLAGPMRGFTCALDQISKSKK